MKEAMTVEEAMVRVCKTRSYDRVYASLTLLDKCRQIWDGLVSRYESLSVRDYRFVVAGPTSHYVELNLGPSFHSNLHENWHQEEHIEGDSWRFRPQSVVDMNFETLAHVAWDGLKAKSVPTFNVDVYQTVGYDFCKKNGHFVPGPKSEKLGRTRQATFKSWFLDQFLDAQREFISERVWDVRAQIQLTKESQDFKDRLQAAILNQCVRDVGEVLSKYSSLGDECLKRAIQNYVAEDVLGA